MSHLTAVRAALAMWADMRPDARPVHSVTIAHIAAVCDAAEALGAENATLRAAWLAHVDTLQAEVNHYRNQRDAAQAEAWAWREAVDAEKRPYRLAAHGGAVAIEWIERRVANLLATPPARTEGGA